MPQPRRSPPRHKIRRSRSYSPGKIQSRSFERKRSRSRERRSSRSPQRKRSEDVKYRSPPPRSEDVKYRSPPPSSHIPRPHFEDKGFPVKRPADSSGKRPVHRSRSPSPSPVKKSKADRAPSPYGKRPAQRSPSPHGGKQRFPNRPEPSSSKAPLFPAAKKQAEIDYVTIVNKGSKMELLSKRFETPDQRLSHGFDFEENITIGIHRGPSHIQLDDGEDVPVNYHFNTKTFRMLFPKKVYDKTLFDRDEIKAFRHDDILDEEAYVEKRTISVKPVDKPKSGKSHDLDYKVSVGRDEYGDRRMVKDSRGHGSRSDMYDDVPVTVRLDPKPDPRYEKLYKEQKRYEDTSMLHDDVQRNPNDLRYNLMRRKSEGDRGDKQGLDARSRIDARRHDDLVSDRHRSSRSLSPEEKYKRRMDQPHLPDFKNRPGKFQTSSWQDNPTETPKSQRYFLHDNRSRDDMNYWERKQMYLQTGTYPTRGRFFRGRGFSFRGRGFIPRGRGRGGYNYNNYNNYNKNQQWGSREYVPRDEKTTESWKHDKYDEVESQDDKEPKEKSADKSLKKTKKKSKSDVKDGGPSEDIKKQEEGLQTDVAITLADG